MPLAPRLAADLLSDLIRRSNKEVLTFPWGVFYKLMGRERMKVAFKEDLEIRLREHALLICYGSAIVLLAKDYNFQPGEA